MQARLVVVGGGRMGEALVAGLVRGGWASPEELAVVEPRPGRRQELEAAHPGLAVLEEAVGADGAVIAVKPGDAEPACRALGGQAVGRVLSVAAGVRLRSLEAWLDPGVAVLRAMPNTAALVGAAASGLAPGRGAGEPEIAWAEEILGSVGMVVRLSEPGLDAVTGLSGSGPAYLFLVAEALTDAGVLVGLSHEVSRALVTQTLLGAARLLAESGETAAALRSGVTSPGGTTAAGLRALEAHGVRAAFLDAVAAAAARAAELGRQ
ncbi:MAG: pyrroline-5-carboxylate reductase [Acidimicrobiales bacterium]